MVLVFFFLLIVGCIFSKIGIKIRKLKIENVYHIKSFKIEIVFYYFEMIPIKIIIIEEKFFRLLGIKISYEYIRKINKIWNRIENRVKVLKSNMKEIENWNNYLKVCKSKYLKFESKDFQFFIEIGTIDIIITTILNFIMSEFITWCVFNFIEEKNLKNVKYQVAPNYSNINRINIEMCGILKIKSKNILYLLYKNRSDENGRASNRKFNENSYG